MHTWSTRDLPRDFVVFYADALNYFLQCKEQIGPEFSDIMRILVVRFRDDMKIYLDLALLDSFY